MQRKQANMLMFSSVPEYLYPATIKEKLMRVLTIAKAPLLHLCEVYVRTYNLSIQVPKHVSFITPPRTPYYKNQGKIPSTSTKNDHNLLW